MLIKIGFDIELSVTAPMALIYLLHVHPSRQDDLQTPENFHVSPPVEVDNYIDYFGNHCGRINVPAGAPSVRFTNEAVIADSGLADEVNHGAWQHDPCDLPVSTLQFMLPSRYCEVDSELMQFAWNQFGQAPMGWGRVQAICDYVHHHITFGYEHARMTRTALEAYFDRTGVCRDYAHLAVAFCRCMNIPARYCTGYLGDIGVPQTDAPMDFAAWFEAYLDGHWYTFDARNNTPRIGRVLIARGRDAADVAISNAFGINTLVSFRVWTDEVLT